MKNSEYKNQRDKAKKYVRYKEGAQIYSMGISKFQEVAKKSGAVYKINQLVLVNTEIIDKYIEKFHVKNFVESESERYD